MLILFLQILKEVVNLRQNKKNAPGGANPQALNFLTNPTLTAVANLKKVN
jgi:hypothetical protein